MHRLDLSVVIAAGAVASAALTATGADFASQFVSYVPGADAAPYTNAAAALGSPARMTGVGTAFAATVTPFNPAYDIDQIVSIGTGGSLVLRFDSPVRDDPANPFGLDLLVFGNTGYIDGAYPGGVVAGVFSAAASGAAEVSADGVDWRLVPGVRPDNLFPTLGYSDLTDPYAVSPGAVESDFTRPVDPAFNAMGRSFGEIAAAYAGSGGGTGVDIGLTGLSEISFIRITNAAGANAPLQIDAVSRVRPIPSPGALAIAIGGLAFVARRRRCTEGTGA